MYFGSATPQGSLKMKKIYSVIGVALLIVCRKDLPQMWKTPVYQYSETKVIEEDPGLKIHLDSLITTLEFLQNEVSVNSSSILVLLKQAFDTSTECFYSVGKGVVNREFPKEAYKASQISSAKASGQEWAIKLKSWYSGNKSAFAKKVDGEVLYSKPVFQKFTGDTLVMLLETPIGSIQIY